MTDTMLVRANAAVAGGPPVGEVGTVPRDLGEAGVRSGRFTDLSDLSSRLADHGTTVPDEWKQGGDATDKDASDQSGGTWGEERESEGTDEDGEPTEVPANGTVVELHGKSEPDPEHPSVR